jgi:hypothetical protein
MSPSEVAKLVKENLLNRPNKKVVFGSFCNALGEDLTKFLTHCNKFKESIREKEIEKLKARLKELEG